MKWMVVVFGLVLTSSMGVVASASDVSAPKVWVRVETREGGVTFFRIQRVDRAGIFLGETKAETMAPGILPALMGVAPGAVQLPDGFYYLIVGKLLPLETRSVPEHAVGDTYLTKFQIASGRLVFENKEYAFPTFTFTNERHEPHLELH